MDSVNALKEIAQQLAKAREQKQLFEKAAREVQRDIEQLEVSLYNGLTNAGLEKQHYPGIGTFSASLKSIASVLPDDQRFFDYLRSKGDEGIIKYSVHYQTLQSYYKREIPEDVSLESIGLSVFEKPSITFRKDK